MDRIVCAFLCLSAIAVAVCVLVCCAEPPAQPTTAETTAESTEVVTEPTEETTIATEPPTVPEVALYDVPLDVSLQEHIVKQADKAGIDPAIIVAMAYKESTYNHNAIGDGGNSYGLLQVQPRWHYERMQKLNCTDLLDPYQNVAVAVDYLCELLNRYGSIEAALTAYNRGSYSGKVTQYAKTILAHAEKLNNERSQ